MTGYNALYMGKMAYHTVLHNGYNGVYFGIQPNGAVLNHDNVTEKEDRRGFFYFGVPKIFDYLRLPQWLYESIDGGAYLECWTKDGWVRCPIERKFGSLKIRMPHPRLTPTTKSRPFQDVIYTEMLPSIPDNVLLCGPGTNNQLPVEIGNVLSNTAYYPACSIYNPIASYYDKTNDNRWQTDRTAWGVSTLDFCVRPIAGYYFRFVTTIGGTGTIGEFFDGIVDRSAETVSAVISIQNTPPTDPQIGDRYIVDDTPTGAWIGYESEIAEWGYTSGTTLGWIFTSPISSPDSTLIAYVIDEDKMYEYLSPGQWNEYSAGLMALSGNIEEPTTRDLIFRALHTTPPQFINIAKSDCWIEDVRVSSSDASTNDIDIVIAGYKTDNNVRKFKSEIHTIKVRNK
jgi:hypothetical protein